MIFNLRQLQGQKKNSHCIYLVYLLGFNFKNKLLTIHLLFLKTNTDELVVFDFQIQRQLYIFI